MRVQKLIPDEDSVGDPNWNKPFIKDAHLTFVRYPCKNGNGCETMRISLDEYPYFDEIVRDPSKCNLPASSLKP